MQDYTCWFKMLIVYLKFNRNEFPVGVIRIILITTEIYYRLVVEEIICIFDEAVI